MHKTDKIEHMPRRAVYAAAAVVFGVCSCLQAASKTIQQATAYVVTGQWQEALQTLQSAEDRDAPSARQLRGLLLEYQALQRQRHEQRQAVVREKYQALEALDLTGADEKTLQEAMGLFKAAWDNATDAERNDLLETAAYQTLRSTIQERFEADVQAGRWDAAWSPWLNWLVEIEPQRFRNAAEDLRRRRAILNAIRVNPCDASAVPYAHVQRDTALRVFQLLQERYVEPVPFDRLGEAGLKRLSLLPDVLANPTVTTAVPFEANGFSVWTDHINALLEKPPASAAETTEMLDTLLAINQTTLKLPEGVIIAQFTEGALAALDPYTQVIWPEGVSQFEKNLTGQFGGVGIRIRKDGDELVIVSVIPDTPAAETTLAADDIILAVDGKSTRSLPTDCGVQLISGPVGTSVSLTVRHPDSDKTEVVTVTRQKIVLPTVEGIQRADNGKTHGRWDYFLDAKDCIGYLRLNGFTEKTTEQALRVLTALEQRQILGLIVDMRGNGGGLLNEATAFANLFIDDGPLLSTSGRGENNIVWQAHPNGPRRTYPIVILIDEGSASASEVVAGIVATRLPEQVTLIGQRTYGKGCVQEIVDLGPDGGRLKLTTAYYFLPNGQAVPNRHKLESQNRRDWGIAPAIELPLYPYEQSRIQDIQNERRRQLMAKEIPADADLKTESLTQQMLMTDAQLSAAVVLLKARIMAGC